MHFIGEIEGVLMKGKHAHALKVTMRLLEKLPRRVKAEVLSVDSWGHVIGILAQTALGFSLHLAQVVTQLSFFPHIYFFHFVWSVNI